MSNVMKRACDQCPFKKTVKPYIRYSRAEQFAYGAANPYNDFYCHKTLGHDDEGGTQIEEKSMECAGFVTLQLSESGRSTPEGFEPDESCFQSINEMLNHYEENAF